MNNAPVQLVHARVMHARLRPATNKFVYPVFYVRVNLSRLAECRYRWFGIDCWRPATIRTRDYGPRDGASLEAWMRACLKEHDIEADGDIWLQTFPRVFGYSFNPVSFWHCYDSTGNLRAVLAEVNNTFGETHRYLLRIAQSDTPDMVCAISDKEFHVSPFCEIKGHYQFAFRIGTTQHRTNIHYHDNDGPLIRTAMTGHVAPMTDAALLRAIVRYPLLGIGIVLRIHWQAFRLWRKGVTFFKKPDRGTKRITINKESI
jgi:DUF1365 family protein